MTVRNAISKASKMLHKLYCFQVVESRGYIENNGRLLVNNDHALLLDFTTNHFYLFSVYFLINVFTSAGASWSFSTILSPLTPIR